MGTTKEQIRKWLEEGKKENYSHVIIVCDSLEYEDYPVFVKSKEDINEKVKQIDGHNMQFIMEIYDLSIDINFQLYERKALHLGGSEIEHKNISAVDRSSPPG